MNGDPERVCGLLHSAADPEARLVAAAWKAVVDGRLMAVVGNNHGQVRTLELATGEETGKSTTYYDGPVLALATAVLEGDPIAVTAAECDSVRLWDCPRESRSVRLWPLAPAGCRTLRRRRWTAAPSPQPVTRWEGDQHAPHSAVLAEEATAVFLPS
ncbi:hypothetical protein [Nonomuraea angiospora]